MTAMTATTTTSRSASPVVSSRRGRRLLAGAALTLSPLPAAAATASASQDAGPRVAVAQPSAGCPLARVGTQYVRCDNLTGNGVPAPA